MPVRPAPNAFGAVYSIGVKIPLAAQTWKSMFLATVAMEKPSVRGPSPGRKAVRALGPRLNCKPKPPPPLPVKKNVPDPGRMVNR
jgi:hypothetical protein